MVQNSSAHWIDGTSTMCTDCCRQHCLWQRQGPGLVKAWLKWMKVQEKYTGMTLTVNDRKRYIFGRMVRRIYGSDSNHIEPPECVVVGVTNLPPALGWYEEPSPHHLSCRTDLRFE
jgi:hypothetical protein